jgi:hypothetical protein
LFFSKNKFFFWDRHISPLVIICCFLWIEDTEMPIQYKVTLTQEERLFLVDLTSHGKTSARKIKRANILLKSDEGGYDNQSLAEIVETSESPIHRTKRAFVEEGLSFALEEGSCSGQPRKQSASQEATLITIACTKLSHPQDVAVGHYPYLGKT